MTNKNKSKQRNNKNIDKHMKAGDIEWNVNEIEYASVLGDNILQNNKFWCLREKKTRNEVLEDIEDHINKIDVLISELKQEFYSVVTMSDNTKMSKQRKNPPPTPMSQGPVKNLSLVLNLEQTVDQELNESEASFMPSTQPSQQSQDQPSQDQTADESMFISGVTVASTQDVAGQDAIEHVVGREVTKQVKEDLEEKNQDLETKNADLKTKINNIGDLHGIDVTNTMKLHEKIKMKETENQKLVMEMSEKDNVIHGLRTAERDLSDQIKEGERREAMMKKMIKERDEEKERLFSVTEKQKKIVDKKEEMILKLHGEAEQSSNKIQAYREREQDLLKKLQVVQKELEDCKNQMKDFKKSNEVTV